MVIRRILRDAGSKNMYAARIVITATEAISQGRQARHEGNFAVARARYAEAW